MFNNFFIGKIIPTPFPICTKRHWRTKKQPKKTKKYQEIILKSFRNINRLYFYLASLNVNLNYLENFYAFFSRFTSVTDSGERTYIESSFRIERFNNLLFILIRKYLNKRNRMESTYSRNKKVVYYSKMFCFLVLAWAFQQFFLW